MQQQKQTEVWKQGYTSNIHFAKAYTLEKKDYDTYRLLLPLKEGKIVEAPNGQYSYTVKRGKFGWNIMRRVLKPTNATTTAAAAASPTLTPATTSATTSNEDKLRVLRQINDYLVKIISMLETVK